jgi:hypothetical protein
VVKIGQLKDSYSDCMFEPKFNVYFLYSNDGKCPPKVVPLPFATLMWIWGLSLLSKVPEKPVIYKGPPTF